MSVVTTQNNIERDSDLLSLIASLTLEDVKELQDDRRSSVVSIVSQDTLSDEELAVQLYAEEANSLLLFAQDSALAYSMNAALRSDRALIREMVQEETRAIRDRRMALAIDAGRSVTPIAGARIPDDPAPLMSTDVSESEDEIQKIKQQQLTPKPSRVTLRPKPVAPPREIHDCIICTDPIRGVEITAPCGHYYDVACLIDLFRSTVRDESLFPPRCCQQPFVFDSIRQHLGFRLAAEFQEKAAEFSTADRVYCHRNTCSTFLGAAAHTMTLLRCRICASYTCAHCKEASHTGRLCSSASDTAVLDLASREGWKRCPGCHSLVELSVGCFHMTCRCRKQFCYVCTETWKNCACPQWDENRLIAVAEDRVNRQIRAQPAARPVAAAFRTRVVEMADLLRENHDCAHTVWRYRAGGGRCEVCNFNLPQFLLCCRGCQMLACVRCRRNRL